jgi:hypothetical protein
MLNNYLKPILLVSGLVGFINSSYAQPSASLTDSDAPKAGLANSPLSRYGIGDVNPMIHSTIKGMGGIATAYNNPFTINTYNPASYAFLKHTTYDVSINAVSNKFLLGANEYKASTFSLGNLALAFPLTKNWGMSFGYMPKSTMYYNARRDVQAPVLDTVAHYFYGTGALHNLHLGTAYKYKGFSIGANANYIFGNTLRSSSIEVSDLYGLNSEFVDYYNMNGLQFKIGALYQHIIKEKYYIHVGASYEMKANLNTNLDQYAMSYRYATNQDGSIKIDAVDTLHNFTQLNTKNHLYLPSEFSLGIHAGKSAYWNVGIDFVYTNWNEYAWNKERLNIADNTYRFSFGGEFTPNPEAIDNKFANNITFRLGGYYGTDYRMIAGEQLKYYGGTFGLGLPLFRSYGSNGKGIVNFSFDIGKLSNGKQVAALYNNNYFKFNVGFNLNDLWFIKRKFD